MKYDDIMNRIRGCLFGVAVGDALGVPVEFMSKDMIRERYGVLDKMVGYGTHGQEPGTVSDDTQMMLAVAKGIIKNPEHPVGDIGMNFVDWMSSEPFDVGVCCSAVIGNMMNKEPEDIKNEKRWFECSKRYGAYGRSGGNGGLMRTAYVGCYYDSKIDILKHAEDICKMTHWDEEAIYDCKLVSVIIHELIKYGMKELISYYTFDDSYYGNKYRKFEVGEVGFNVKSSGYGVNSLLCAVHSVLTTDNFRDAVVKAVNMGGDTDTIGAITGSIAGALYGMEEIPMEWILALNEGIRGQINGISEVAYNNLMKGGVKGEMWNT